MLLLSLSSGCRSASPPWVKEGVTVRGVCAAVGVRLPVTSVYAYTGGGDGGGNCGLSLGGGIC